MPIVVVGSSAGGLQPMRAFLAAIEDGCGAAYVLVTHHREGHEGLLSGLLSDGSDLPVRDIEDDTELEPDVVFVAPAGRYLQLSGNVAHVIEPPAGESGRSPIDFFLRELARHRGERAVGIVLSGTGSDGTRGLLALRHAGGMTMAQRPASAEYPGMPDSAIDAGAVDHVLPPDEMPDEVAGYLAHLARHPPAAADGEQEETNGRDLGRVLELLEKQTGNDFSGYRRTTVERRIRRRMAVLHLESFSRYLDHLREHAPEVELLGKELLIGVTSFYRDPDAFEALGSGPLPELLESLDRDHVVRVWVPGCATGEEAYSLAIMVRECMEAVGRSRRMQVFATDLDAEAVEQARSGEYPETIASEVGPERLARYFVKDGSRYRVRGDIRDAIVFASHNILRDPPFTHLDLLSCRNLLIYLQAPLQRQVLSTFHYALRPDGILFLGGSETAGDEALFRVIDKKHKIFVRREDAAVKLAPLPSRRRSPRLAAPRSEHGHNLTALANQAMIDHLVPPSVLVNERGEVVHIHGRTGAFLEPSPGLQTRVNVLNMAREGLGPHLSIALHEAASNDADEVIKHRIRIRNNGEEVHTDVHIRSIRQPEALRGLYLLSFENTVKVAAGDEEEDADGAASTDQQESVDDDQVRRLERDLQHERDGHQSAVEELEATNEEMTSTNEELQSTNEELQSTNEELETSKEEMQSLNEELQTVNSELQDKLEELQHANDDMSNLLSSTEIAILFLDGALCIQRFTDRARTLLSVIPSDVGRPISDLQPRLRYGALIDDAREVQRTLEYKEVEVQGTDDGWYLMRILPYRTADNVIDGLVVTLVEITAIKELQVSERHMREALAGTVISVYSVGAGGTVQWVFGDVMGVPRSKAIGHRLAELGRKEAVELFDRVFEQGAPERLEVSGPDGGGRQTYELYMVPSTDDEGHCTGVTCVQTSLEGDGGGRGESES